MFKSLVLAGGLLLAGLGGSVTTATAGHPYCGPLPPPHFHHPYHHHAYRHQGVGFYSYRPYVPYYPPVRTYSYYYPAPSNYLYFQNRNISVGFGSW